MAVKVTVVPASLLVRVQEYVCTPLPAAGALPTRVQVAPVPEGTSVADPKVPLTSTVTGNVLVPAASDAQIGCVWLPLVTVTVTVSVTMSKVAVVVPVYTGWVGVENPLRV